MDIRTALGRAIVILILVVIPMDVAIVTVTGRVIVARAAEPLLKSSV